jgi:hypothetical protein
MRIACQRAWAPHWCVFEFRLSQQREGPETRWLTRAADPADGFLLINALEHRLSASVTSLCPSALLFTLLVLTSASGTMSTQRKSGAGGVAMERQRGCSGAREDEGRNNFASPIGACFAVSDGKIRVVSVLFRLVARPFLACFGCFAGHCFGVVSPGCLKNRFGAVSAVAECIKLAMTNRLRSRCGRLRLIPDASVRTWCGRYRPSP